MIRYVTSSEFDKEWLPESNNDGQRIEDTGAKAVSNDINKSMAGSANLEKTATDQAKKEGTQCCDKHEQSSDLDSDDFDSDEFDPYGHCHRCGFQCCRGLKYPCGGCCACGGFSCKPEVSEEESEEESESDNECQKN